MISTGVEIDWEDSWDDNFLQVSHTVIFGINFLKMEFGQQLIFISAVKTETPHQVVSIEAIVKMSEEASCF